MLAAGITALILTIILSLSVGIDLSYGPEGLMLSAKLGGARIQLIPFKASKKVKPKKDKPTKPEAEEAEEEEEEKEKEPLLQEGELKELIGMGLHAINSFRRGLRVDLLQIHYVAAGDDAAKTAISFGKLNAVIGGLLPVLESVITIKKREIITDIDFMTNKPRFSGRLIITLKIGTIFAIALAFGLSFVNMKYRNR